MIDEDLQQAMLDELVLEATRRAYEAAVVCHGREPTLAETSLVLLQSQIALLASTMLQGDDLLAYWKGVIEVIRGSNGPAGLVS
jgi:hypothetical protein